MNIQDEEWYGTSVHNYNEEQSLDKILELTKEALELAREEDEPRDMQIRFLLNSVVDKLESFRYDNPDYLTNI
jgi:hypothetical protein